MKLTDNSKMVILVDGNLPLGLIANTASVLSLTVGRNVDDIIGHDLIDKLGNNHAGITQVPIPILKSSAEELGVMRNKLFAVSGVHVVDFCDAAQRTKNYTDYSNQISSSDVLIYLGIAIIGDKKVVNKYTGNLPLLR